MKWRAGKMKPKVYGKHLDLGASLEGDVRITFTNADAGDPMKPKDGGS